MALPTYSQADLIVRVLARLGETGFDANVEAAGAQPAASATYTRADLVERILNRLRDAGYADATPGGTYTAAEVATRVLNILQDAGYAEATTGRTYTSVELVDRILARLGEAGFGIDNPAPIAANYTSVDLRARVLVRLGEAGFGEAAEPEADERVRNAMPAIFAELVANRIYIPLGANIPAEAMDALSAVVASKVSGDFALSADEVTLLAARAQAGQELLRRLIFGHQQRVIAALPGIRAEIQHARLYSGATVDPLAGESADAVTTIAAARLAGEFGLPAERQQTLAAAAGAAETTLRRLDLKPLLKVSDALPGIRAELQQRRIYSLAATDPLPRAAGDAVATVAAARLAMDMGLPADRVTVLAASAQAAEANLRRLDIRPNDRVSSALTGILAELSARRIYIGTGDKIEDGAMDALSAISAARMADDFDLDQARVQMLQASAQAAEATLRDRRFGYWERVSYVIPGILAELYDDGVYAFPLDDTIRLAAFDPLSAIVASRLIDDFQVPLDRAQAILLQAQSAEAKLRRLRSEPYVDAPVKVCYF